MSLKEQMQKRRLQMQQSRSSKDIYFDPPKHENPIITKIMDLLTGFRIKKTTKDDIEMSTCIQYLAESDYKVLKENVKIKFGYHSQEFSHINILLERASKIKIPQPKPVEVKPIVQNTSVVVEANGHTRPRFSVVE